MNNATEPYPSCLRSWLRHHKTAETIDRMKYLIALKIDSVSSIVKWEEIQQKISQAVEQKEKEKEKELKKKNDEISQQNLVIGQTRNEIAKINNLRLLERHLSTLGKGDYKVCDSGITLE